MSDRGAVQPSLEGTIDTWPEAPEGGWDRVLLKLSGEAFAGDGDLGVDPDVVQSIARQIAGVVRSAWRIGTQTCSRNGKPKPGGITPMIVASRPLTRTGLPTICGSLPKRSRHAASPRSATIGAPATSSASVMLRPSAGCTPSSSKRLPVMNTPS